MSIDSMGLDVLREIANIGSGNAAGALATMLDRKVDIGIPHCEMIPFSQITNSFSSPEEVVAGTLVQMSGDMDGFVMMMLTLDSAISLVEILNAEKIKCARSDYEALSTEFGPIEEIGNILAGSYLSAIATMTGMSIIPSVPALTIDMVMAMMNIPIVIYGEVGETVLYMESEFFTEGAGCFKGQYFMVPTMESYDRMMSMLGL